MRPDTLTIADRTFSSRLFVGTGKYTSRQIYGPLTPELQKERDEYIFKKTGRKPTQRDQ